MADIQKHFINFHSTIKLDNFKENKELREKKKIVVDKVRDGIKKQFTDKEEATPTFDDFNQGSYAMSTGVQAIKGDDYDIDVGLSFNLAKKDYSDPTEVKKWVYKALEGHTNDIEIKRPCVRVSYEKNGSKEYHIDLAIYSDSECNDDGKMYLAKGYLGSNDENKIWEASNPKELIRLVQEHFDDTKDRDQFRRCIRYLKRWKDFKFPVKGDGKPTGIALTISALQWFQPEKEIDLFSNHRTDDDLKALTKFVSSMINNFSSGRLIVKMPIEPHNDLFEKFSDQQMEKFKEKLINLKSSLESAANEADPAEACDILIKEFGDDFPKPEKKETAQKKKLATTYSSSSA